MVPLRRVTVNLHVTPLAAGSTATVPVNLQRDLVDSVQNWSHPLLYISKPVASILVCIRVLFWEKRVLFRKDGRGSSSSPRCWVACAEKVRTEPAMLEAVSCAVIRDLGMLDKVLRYSQI